MHAVFKKPHSGFYFNTARILRNKAFKKIFCRFVLKTAYWRVLAHVVFSQQSANSCSAGMVNGPKRKHTEMEYNQKKYKNQLKIGESWL